LEGWSRVTIQLADGRKYHSASGDNECARRSRNLSTGEREDVSL
jgi:hypothetical protein